MYSDFSDHNQHKLVIRDRYPLNTYGMVDILSDDTLITKEKTWEMIKPLAMQPGFDKSKEFLELKAE